MAQNHSSPTDGPHNHTGAPNEGGHHIVAAATLTKVLLILVFFTVLTVVTAKFVYLGSFAVPVAFGIALVKASFVMAVFMGLKWETRGNRFAFSLGFVFLGLLFFFCMLDYYSRVAQGSTL